MSATANTRAGDADRSKVVDALATAFSEGQLTQPEYDERSRTALQATTLGVLHGLTADLQDPPMLEGIADTAAGAGLPPTHSTTTGIAVLPWIVRLLSVALLVGVVWVGIRVWGSITGDDEAPQTAASDPGDPADGDAVDIPPIVIPTDPDVLSVDGFNRIVDLMRSELGTTTVTGLNLQEHAASFELRRAGEPGIYSYYYDGFIGEPSHNETGKPSGPRVDVADIDVPAVMRLMDGLPERFGIANATSRFITLQSGGYYSRGPALDLYLSGPSRTGYLIVGLDGTVIHEQRP